MNFIMILFSLLTTSIILTGSLLNSFESKLPTFFVKLIRYGKFAHDVNLSGLTSKIVIEVPKSWFKHFYCIGCLSFSFLFYQLTIAYVTISDSPEWLHNFINLTCGIKRQTNTIKVYIATLLMFIQVWRRFYDTHFVSIFGKNARINIAQYIIGLIHYPCCALAIICEAPKFASLANNISLSLKWHDLSNFDILAVILFIWAWWHQHVTTKILANLRKDKKGKIVTDDHKLPQGDWFHFFSCPHQIAEILMYFSITILLWYNITWFFAFTWVLSNQIMTILLSHRWYQSTFENFPNNRKALIPHVY